MEITSPNPRKIYAGRRFTIRFRTDAAPRYFKQPELFLTVLTPPSIGNYPGRTNVQQGHSTAYFQAAEDLEVGTKAKLTLKVRPSQSAELNASVEVKVVPLPEPVGTGKGRIPTPNVRLQWVEQGDAVWEMYGWTTESVAAVNTQEDSVDIFVSVANKRLDKLISRAQRRDLSAVETLKDFYLEHISYYAFIASNRHGNGVSQDDETADDPIHQDELKRACETICGIMESLFEMLIRRAPE